MSSRKDPRDVERSIIARTAAGTKRLPMLDVIFSGIQTDLTSAMKSHLGLLTEVSGTDIEYRTWGDVVSGMKPDAICAVSTSHPWKGDLMVVIDAEVFYAAFEMQMSGPSAKAEVPDRAPSTIERRVAKRIAQVFLDQLSANFNRVTSVKFSAESVESRQQVVSNQGDGAPCVVASTSIKVGETSGKMVTVIPLSTLDPVQQSLSTMFLGKNFEADVTWRDMLSKRVKGSCVEVQAVIERKRIPVSEILLWKPGHVIELSVDGNDEIAVTCSGMTIMHAQRGHKKGRSAMRITRDTGEKPEDGTISIVDMRDYCAVGG